MLPPDAALIVIDLQKAIDHPSWGERNNPTAEKNIARLLDAWRATQRPIYHVAHDSTEPASHYRPGQPGNEFKTEAQPLPGEIVIRKNRNSAFIGTDLESRLRQAQREILIVTGVITNNSVEATVRMAGNLGFETYLVADATFTFGRKDWNGIYRTASEVHAMSRANLDGEYCTVTETDAIIEALDTNKLAVRPHCSEALWDRPSISVACHPDRPDRPPTGDKRRIACPTERKWNTSSAEPLAYARGSVSIEHPSEPRPSGSFRDEFR